MPGVFDRVTIGQPLAGIRAESWNAMLEAAEAFAQGRPDQPGGAQPLPGAVVVLGLNDTGADLREYKPAAVTAAGGYDLEDDFAAQHWKRRPLFTLSEPTTVADFVVVTLDAIPAGKIGRVVISGPALCDIDSAAGATYAAPQVGDTAALLGGTTGTVRVLHVPSTGGSQRRCAVYLHEKDSAGKPRRYPLGPACLVPGTAGGIAGLSQIWYDPATGEAVCEFTALCEGTPCEGDDVDGGAGGGGGGAPPGGTGIVTVNGGAWGTPGPLTGDVTTTGAGLATTIANDAVTDAKLRNSAAMSVIGRSANSTGDPADIAGATVGHVLQVLTGPTLGFGPPASASAEAVLSANWTISAATGTFQAITGWTLSVPATGTYNVTLEARGGTEATSAGNFVVVRLTNNGSTVTDTALMIAYAGAASVLNQNSGCATFFNLSLTSGDTLGVEVKREFSGSSTNAVVSSNSTNGQSRFGYQRVG